MSAHCRTTAVALVVAVLSSGCALRPDATQLAAVDAVEVTRVEVQKVSYSGTLPPEYEPEDGNNWFGSIFTAPVALIVEAFKYPGRIQDRRDRIELLLTKKCDVEVTEYVEKWFTKEFEKAELGEIAFTDEDASVDTHVLTFDVEYGIEGGDTYGYGWTPWVEITAELWSPENERIWKCSRFVGEGDKLGVLPHPDPLGDEKRVRRGFRKTVHEVCKQLMRDLTRERNRA